MDKEFKDLIKSLKLDEKVFTEEVVEKMAVIMETKLSDERDKLKEELADENAQELKEYKQFLETQLDNYLNEFTSEFVEKNTEQINESVKVKTAEKVLEHFKSLVSEFNMVLSEDAVGDELQSDTLKEQLNDAVNAKIELEEKLKEMQITKLIEKKGESIQIDSQRKKFEDLAEGLSFEGEETFEAKLQTLKETINSSGDDDDNADDLKDKELEEQQDKNLEESASASKDDQDEILSYLQN